MSIERRQGERRTGRLLEERSLTDRRVSPAVGEFAIKEIERLRAENEELCQALFACREAFRTAAVYAACKEVGLINSNGHFQLLDQIHKAINEHQL